MPIRPWKLSLRIVFALLLVALSNLAAAQVFDPPRGDLRVVVLNDINSSYGSTTYIPSVLRAVEHVTDVWRPDLLLGAGDLVAGQSALLPDARFAEMWASFDRYITGPLRAGGIPHAFALGNHDASSQKRNDGTYVFARERQAARDYWNQPMFERNLAYVDRDDFPFHYSFRHGPLFVVVWDATSARLEPSRLEWLERQLASQEARSAAYRIVMGHLPLFGVAVGRNAAGEVLADGDALRGRLEAAGADLYLSGHHHAFFPGRRGELKLLNTGGVGPRPLLAGTAPPRTTVTIVDFRFASGWVDLTTFDLASGREVTLAELPASIDGLNGAIERWDGRP